MKNELVLPTNSFFTYNKQSLLSTNHSVLLLYYKHRAKLNFTQKNILYHKIFAYFTKKQYLCTLFYT